MATNSAPQNPTNLITALENAFKIQDGEPITGERIAQLLAQNMGQLSELARQGKLNPQQIQQLKEYAEKFNKPGTPSASSATSGPKMTTTAAAAAPVASAVSTSATSAYRSGSPAPVLTSTAGDGYPISQMLNTTNPGPLQWAAAQQGQPTLTGGITGGCMSAPQNPTNLITALENAFEIQNGDPITGEHIAQLLAQNMGQLGELNPQQIQQLEEHAVRLNKPAEMQESHRRQLEVILRWLAALNCTDKHNYMRQLCQEGTCKWLPNTDVYGQWRTRRAQSLWLHGKAGCGKSVLVASTIEHLKSTLRYGEVLVFFYFDFRNERSRSPVEMMRSLLSQLCRHLLDAGVDPGNFPNTILEEKGKGTLNDLDKLCGLVSCAADRFGREPIVVIDALDECVDIEPLLRALVSLHDDDKVRLLVTSRPHHETMRHFTKFPSLSFEDVAMELAADIALHVEREISHDRLRFASPEMKKAIHAKLITKAEGRFWWVQSQIDILKWCTTAQELKKALDPL